MQNWTPIVVEHPLRSFSSPVSVFFCVRSFFPPISSQRVSCCVPTLITHMDPASILLPWILPVAAACLATHGSGCLLPPPPPPQQQQQQQRQQRSNSSSTGRDDHSCAVAWSVCAAFARWLQCTQPNHRRAGSRGDGGDSHVVVAFARRLSGRRQRCDKKNPSQRRAERPAFRVVARGWRAVLMAPRAPLT